MEEVVKDNITCPSCGEQVPITVGVDVDNEPEDKDDDDEED